MENVKIGFIGYGEAAYNISLGLKGEGLTGITATDMMLNDPTLGKRIHDRAAEAGVTLLPSDKEVIADAEIVISAVPLSCAVEACQSAKRFLRPDQLYVDVSTSPPSSKKLMSEMLDEISVRYIDAAMLGGLPTYKHKVPIIACGKGSVEFKTRMTPFGMNISIIDGDPGAACAVKLVRSIYMKGMTALLIETLEAAHHYNVSERIIASLTDTLDSVPLIYTINDLITGAALHCARRAGELGASIEMLKQAGIDCCMSEAAKRRHEELIPYNFGSKYADHMPKDWVEIISQLKE